MEDPSVVKLFHGGDTDLQLLAADLDICCLNVFDTARCYQLIQKGVTMNFISLEKLLKLLLDVTLDKTFQVADWRIRPLP